MGNNKLVSVIITTYKRGRKLSDALISVIQQTHQNIEIIVVDDDPDSLQSKLCNSIKDEYNVRLKYIRNATNMGGGQSRNIGIDNSSGEYVCFLDDDDLYYPEKVECLLKKISHNKHLDVVFGGLVKNGAVVFPVPQKGIKLDGLKHLKYLHTNTSLIKRKCINKVRFLPKLPKFQDTQFHAYLIKEFNCYYYDNPVAIWNSEHAGEQVTDMTTQIKIKKSIDSYIMLINDLRVKKYLSFAEHIKMKVSLINMLRNYFFRFGKISDFEISLLDKIISIALSYIYKYDKYA